VLDLATEVFAFLDCGIYDNGFARVACPECPAEYLVAFSCKRRGFCPWCAAKRGALFGAFLAEEVLEDAGHCLWTFTIPKMLRPFLRDEGLLTESASSCCSHGDTRDSQPTTP
jgi:hypothetical protein